MRIFEPDCYLKSVCDIDLPELVGKGVRCLLLDMDNTLRPRDTGVVPDGVQAWMQQAKEMGFRLCVVSNNAHVNVRRDAAAMGIAAVRMAMKPLPFGFLAALRKMGCKRCEAVAIGDQLLTDILGARLCGISPILVVPQSRRDIKITTMVRKLEKKLLHGRRPGEF